ncbi:TonB-dependent receptor plug domain-containing protein [Niveispirillum sp. KHB5.9]|uniref:TonB-dependent receptor plug domain-containing protein n=1 Tax=Niveispirillum sp. KHB5.9 TaxID=3400269 RepID=UPI003A849648
MTNYRVSKSGALRAALLTGAAAMLLTSVPAMAQSSQGASEGESLTEIVVVGSRLRRDQFNSPSPVQVINREESVLAGLVSTGDLLQSSGITSGSSQLNNAFGGFVTNGGPGANTVSLRGLGAGRTLVLINGRRVMPSGTRGSVGSTDLNTLPNAIVDHVEVLREGASSIYGSDAIAGVINIVTQKNVEGVTAEGQFTRPFDNGGEQARASIVGGTSGDRWQVAGSLEYYQQMNLTLADRDWTQCNLDYQRNPTTGASTDFIDPMTGQPKCYPVTGTGSNGVTINTLGTASIAGIGAPGSVSPGTSSTFNRWRPNSAITAGLPGFEGVGGGTNNINVRDTFDPRTLNRSLLSPVKTYNFFGQASYQLDEEGAAEAYAEFLYNRRESWQTGYRQLSLDYPHMSALVPTSLQGRGTAFGSLLHTGSGLRAFIGFGNDRSEQEIDFYKGTGGLRGDLTFVPNWRYDFNVSHANSEGSYKQQSFLTDKMSNSVNVVAAPAGFNSALVRPGANGGNVTCAVNITNPAENCIAAPILNSATIGGVLPKDWVNYVFRDVIGNTEYRENTATLNMDGPIFEMPAGTVQLALGAEYREAKIDDTPDPNSVAGNLLNLTTSAPTRGKDNVYELFGEVEVPLLKDLPLVEELTFTGSGRYTEYDSYGSDWTYKVGGNYRATKWFSIRSTYGTSFRAPALYEQFLGTTSGFQSSQNDPCNNWGAAGVNANVKANCAAEGLAPTYSATQSIQVNSGGGRAAGVEAETSKNFGLGAVFQPDLPEEFGEFSFAADYFDIQIDNSVSRIGYSEILTRCYTSAEFRNGAPLCRLVSAREAGTNRLIVSDSYTNIASSITSGLDYNIRYRTEVGEGDVTLNGQLTQFFKQKSKTFADQAWDEYNGTLNTPEYTLNADLTYRIDGFSFRYGLEWIASMDSYELLGLNPATDVRIAKVPSYDLHHFSAQYKAEDWGVTVGVRNAFDKQPPKISAGLTGAKATYNRIGNSPLYSGYDYNGRRVYMTVSKSF